MPKIRGIKPDFWTDDDVVELSAYARLLFIGLWNYACDNGHVEDRPRQIKMRILPADPVDVDELLNELARNGSIERNRCDNGGVITIPNLPFHQKPHKRWYTTCDVPGCKRPEDEGDSAVSAKKKRRNGSAPVDNSGATVGHGRPTADGDGDGDGDGELTSSEVADATTDPGDDREDVTGLCDRLAAAIEANGSRRPNVTKRWRDAARLLLDRDGFTVEQVEWLIDWSQADDFWRSNILSMPKLREKFDQLKLRAVGPSSNGQLAVDPDWALR